MKKIVMLTAAALLLSAVTAGAQSNQPTDDTDWAPSEPIVATEDRGDSSEGAAPAAEPPAPQAPEPAAPAPVSQPQ